ncbi:ECF transporter S component [Planomicrobium sp. CPCC 101110]|uniref:ECF transporter S component n=1 Tax=Planomicrobium sp. CPCC 101110 TaxID=2599619 RepID=UPI0011B645CA|nr:ECF transporter S component [Planomicrobium sp. CPCC 101110]TWT27623.1 ECF transporter S component [Planomicrobium sp. CPCC 101110]
MKPRNMALAALFISLSAIGGMLKIPLGVASIALDAMPALVAALFLSAPLAGVVAALGHLASALYGGFPLGPFHAMIAFEMGLAVWLFTKMHKDGRRNVKWIAFVLGNGVVAAIPFYFLLSPAFFYAAVPGLLAASGINALGAGAIMPFMEKRLREGVK